MNSNRSAKGPLRTAAWAVVFLLVMDAAITRTDLLWGPTAFENAIGERLSFGQMYQVARTIYDRPDDPGATRVALLGNSRIWIGGREGPVRDALLAAQGGRRFRVDNLGLFGTGPVSTNLVWRHARRDLPDALVLTFGPTDLLISTTNSADAVARATLNLGFRDPAGDPQAVAGRPDRWLRTLWRLFRFHEFARAALAERIARQPATEPFPDYFDSRAAIFRRIRPPAAEEMLERRVEWRAAPDLAGFVRFLKVGQADHLVAMRERAARGVVEADVSRNLAAIDQLVGEVSRSGAAALVLMMPENPLLGEDSTGAFHIEGFSDFGTERIREVARRHDLDFVDGRRWLAAKDFLDLDHPLPALSGFEPRLAREVLRILDTR